ncbi:MAG: hypothetical protein WKF91_20240 [Segetibacter sp.]
MFVIAPQRDKESKPETLKIPFYAPFNFIFDSSGNVFYYQLSRSILNCGTDYDYTTPAYIGLLPENIIQFCPTDFERFLETNIFSVDSDYRVVSVASVQDTVKSPVMKLLVDSFSDSANHTRYYLRKTTQEEEVVLSHKRQQKYYNVDNFNWYPGKIRFMSLLTDSNAPFKK